MISEVTWQFPLSPSRDMCLFRLHWPGKKPIYQSMRHKRQGFDPWMGKIPWWRAWQPTPVFLPGESHGQKSLAGYSPQGHQESDMTEGTLHGCRPE